MKPMAKGLLRTLGGLFLLLLVVLAVVGIVQSSRSGEQTEAETPFSFDPYGENRFTPVGRGMLVTSDAGLTLFDEGGKTILARTAGYGEPLTAFCGGSAVVWDQGSSLALLITEKGDVREISLSGNGIGGKVNEGGWAVFLARESGSKGVATVLKPDGQAVYRVRLGSSYPVDADLSPDSGTLALLTLQGAGSHVGLYSLNQEEELYGWTGEEEVFFELEYLGNNALLLLSTDRAVFLNGAAGPESEFDFGGEYLKDYALTGEGFAVLALGRNRNGSAARLVTLDREGKLLAELEVPAEVESLSAAGRCVSVLYPDRVTLYDPELREKGSLENASGVQASLVREDGSAIIVAGGNATIFEP
jgi:hypothetical protein